MRHTHDECKIYISRLHIDIFLYLMADCKDHVFDELCFQVMTITIDKQKMNKYLKFECII